jgi:SAM-dependent methyltransferase
VARDFYEDVAEQLPNPEFIFLNYGYGDATSESCEWVTPADMRYQCHLNFVRHVLSGVELADKMVLEVGSGRGGNCHYLSQYTQAKRVYGIDLCEANVRFCLSLNKRANVSFLRGGAEQLPFRSETFDVVLNLESSHGYSHFGRFLAEVHRVLKPQGSFCYSDLWFFEAPGLNWPQRKKELEAAPFELLSEEDISKEVWQALASEGGLVETVRSMANETNREFVEQVVKRLKLVRLMLAAGQFSYCVWRFRKP